MGNVPKNLKYTNEHEWIRVDGEEIIFGIKLNNLEKLSNKDILAFSGIANNYKFFDLLKSKLNVKKTISFPDHYNYSEDELTKIVETSKKQNMTVVTTAKDFCRIDRFKDQITCIDTELYIENKHDLINCIIND